MSQVDIKELLKAGVHYGHKVSRWSPKMEKYIHSKRGGIHIIDLVQTAEKLEEALDFLESVAASGKEVMLVGTKRQARQVIQEVAKDIDAPFVTERWLGGMLTNFETMKERIKYLKDLEEQLESGELEDKYVKKEVLDFEDEVEKMNEVFGGIKHMDKIPGALFITDIITDVNAVREARKLHIPVVAIVDSNANPDKIDYPVPGNDDAIKGLKYIVNLVGQAVRDGKQAAKAKKTEEPKEDKKSKSTKSKTKKKASSKSTKAKKPTKTKKAKSTKKSKSTKTKKKSSSSKDSKTKSKK